MFFLLFFLARLLFFDHVKAPMLTFWHITRIQPSIPPLAAHLNPLFLVFVSLGQSTSL